jgi:DNA-binding LacI/PurR family transcriptional regulator/signal transduction histidine kinase
MNDISGKSRTSIALLIDWAENMYHIDLINGVRSKAQEFECNLIIYVGGCINSPRKWESPRNVIFDMLSGESISGIVVSSATVGHFSTFEQISKFCNKYVTMPVVSVSVPVEGIPSVVADNKVGFRRLLLHLVKDHHYKRIAFIKGPEGNPDVRERFEVYKSVLSEFGLAIENELVEKGEFIWQSGEEAVMNLIGRKHLQIDAICAANDEMAIGAAEALLKLGLRVPEDIAVTGFDDQDLSRFMSPPLSTVKQPIFEQGQRAVELLLALMAGEKVPLRTLIPTEVTIRESCGCMPELVRKNPAVYSASTSAGPDSHDANPRAESSVSIRKEIGNLVLPGEDRAKLDALLFDGKTGNDDKYFFEAFLEILRRTAIDGSEEPYFQEFIDSLRNIAVKKVSSIQEMAFVSDRLHRASLLVTEVFRNRERYLNTLFGKGVRDFRDLSEEMVSIEEIGDIFHIIAHYMAYIGILGFYFCLYEQDDPGMLSLKPTPLLRLISAISPRGELPIPEAGIVYPTNTLLPREYLPQDRQYTIDVEPLFFGTHHLGLALFEFDTKQGLVQSTMQRMFINSVLKVAVFLKQVQNHSLNLEAQVKARTEALSGANEQLQKLNEEHRKAEAEVKRLNEDLEKRVNERTSELLDANTELKKILRALKNTQAKLVQSEKMAALGGLVAGIAHEINTPIGIGVTATSHLDVSIKELERRFKEGKLKKSDLIEHISANKDTAKMILSNLNRAFDLIRSFKQVAADQTSENKRLFKIKEYINEVLLSLKPQIKKTGHSISIVCPDDLAIESYPGPFSQIITNLVMNSIMHAFDEGTVGEISIAISREDDMIRLVYSDNGKGIKNEHLKKIYEPFFTTKRGRGGTGLGLHLVYDIVVRMLGGTIECESEEGKGTSFTIVFPV